MLKTVLRIFLIAIYLPGTSSAVHAALTIEITQGMAGATPIAVVPFGWEGAPSSEPVNVGRIIASDLHRSGLFLPLPDEDLLSRPHEGTEVNFRDWRILGVENLVVGKMRMAGKEYIVQFQLFDVFRNNQMTGYSIRTSRDELRHAAHQISDIIFETLTGKPGAFATRIAYVTETRTSSDERYYSLQVADADGYNPRPILNSKKPIMSPAWSPDGKKLAYVSFENGRPEIYVQVVSSGQREQVTGFRGLNGAPAWSPDGKKLAVVLSTAGSPDIFILDLKSKKLKRLTRSYAIDTEPVWSPTGDELVFTSDRGGQPQLYRISINGGGVERLTFEGNYNARARYSPDGRSLAMVHRDNGDYRIAVMNLENGTLRVLTDTSLDESPSFAPNGSMIIYATDVGNRGVLSAVSVDGRVRQKLVLQEGDAREPVWSPY